MKTGVLFLVVVLVGCNTRLKPDSKPSRQRLSPVQIFDLRSKCQAIVDKNVEDLAIGVVGDALRSEVTSHYNPVTNHCYAEVVVLKNFAYHYPKTPNNYASYALYDAQTRDLILTAHQEGDQRDGNDFRKGGFDSITFDKASEEIHLLMTQEDE